MRSKPKSVNFGDKDTKIKARFSSPNQAERVAILMGWVNTYLTGGGKIEDAKAVMQQDIDKCIEIIEKVKSRHPEVAAKKAAEVKA